VWEYGRFLDGARGEHGIEPGEWAEQRKHPGRPVTYVTWHQARRYSLWFDCQLPTEEQWEFAARGEEGRKYPWGPEPPDESLAFFGAKLKHAAPVGLLPDGATPEGVEGLAGNVWEWTGSNYGAEQKVVRGGAFYDFAGALRAAFRYRVHPEYRGYDFGFRCVRE